MKSYHSNFNCEVLRSYSKLRNRKQIKCQILESESKTVLMNRPSTWNGNCFLLPHAAWLSVGFFLCGCFANSYLSFWCFTHRMITSGHVFNDTTEKIAFMLAFVTFLCCPPPFLRLLTDAGSRTSATSKLYPSSGSIDSASKSLDNDAYPVLAWHSWNAHHLSLIVLTWLLINCRVFKKMRLTIKIFFHGSPLKVHF